MKKLVIIIIGLFLMGCEGEEESLKSIDDSKEVFSTMIEGDYSTEEPTFKNCNIEQCDVSGEFKVYYKASSDGDYLLITVHLNSPESREVFYEKSNTIVNGLYLGEIVELEHTFGVGGGKIMTINETGVSVELFLVEGMPTHLDF